MTPVRSSVSGNHTLLASILQTLKYSDHFGFPLTYDEIYLRLIGIKTTKLQLKNALHTLIKTKEIYQASEYYYLPTRKIIVAHRLQAQEESRIQLKKAHFLAKKLSKVPGVIAIYLTGSLAVLNSDSKSDIDFMVITRDHKLWTTRFLLTLYTSLFGLRRTPSTTSTSGKVCLNLYLSECTLSLPNSKRTLYTAYELIQAKPLVDPLNTRSALLSANPWIKSYLPQAISDDDLSKTARSSSNGQAGYLERILFNLQYLYMKRKITREYITPDSAFFHPNNPAPRI